MPHPEAIAHYPKATRIFIKRIYNRVESGKNALIITVGQTGSGKSLSVINLMIGLYLYRFGKDPSNEYIMQHVLFKAKEFMRAMNNPELKKKEVWMWDESGVDISHKSFQSVQNKIIGWLAQTFRNLQQVVFFTVPSASFIDATVRKLLHYYLEAVTIDKEKKMCLVKPLEIQYNTRMDKIYYHKLRVLTKEGYQEEVEFMAVPKISDELESLYELSKNEFTKDLNFRIENMLSQIEQKEKDNTKGGLTDLQTSFVKDYVEMKGDIKKVAEKRKTTLRAAYGTKSLIKRRGVDIESLVEEGKNTSLGSQKELLEAT